MKNILIVTPLYSPAIGGAATYFKEYVVDNLSKDFNIYVLTKTPAHSRRGKVYSIPSGETVSPVIYKFIFIWDFISSLVITTFIILTKKIELVHTHTSSGLCLGSSLAARIFKRRLIKDLSDMLSSIINVRFPIPDRLICLRGTCTQYALSCGIDESLLTPTFLPFDKEPLHKNIPSAQRTEKYFYYAGEIKHSKGVGKILRLARQLPTYQFILSGPRRETELVTKLLMEHNVQLLLPLNHDEVLIYMKNSQALLQPSDSEGIPRVVIEALSTGIPVVCKKGALWTEMFADAPGIYLSDFNRTSFQTVVKRLGRSAIPLNTYKRFTVSKTQYRRFLLNVYEDVLE